MVQVGDTLDVKHEKGDVRKFDSVKVIGIFHTKEFGRPQTHYQLETPSGVRFMTDERHLMMNYSPKGVQRMEKC